MSKVTKKKPPTRRRKKPTAAHTSGPARNTGGDTGGGSTSEICRTVEPLVGQGGTPSASKILIGDPCCDEGYAVFFDGFNRVSEPARSHLGAFAAALRDSHAEGELLEYCVMIWGLKDQERKRLVDQLMNVFRAGPIIQ